MRCSEHLFATASFVKIRYWRFWKTSRPIWHTFGGLLATFTLVFLILRVVTISSGYSAGWSCAYQWWPRHHRTVGAPILPIAQKRPDQTQCMPDSKNEIDHISNYVNQLSAIRHLLHFVTLFPKLCCSLLLAEMHCTEPNAPQMMRVLVSCVSGFASFSFVLSTNPRVFYATFSIVI